MKKLIAICFFMATAFTVNAQTKEETISWLKQKLRTYIKSNDNLIVKIDKIDECYIDIYIKDLSNRNDWDYNFMIPTNEFEIDSSGQITFPFESIYLRYYDDSNNRAKYISGISYTYFSIANGENDIYSRLIKAVAHLNTFCPKAKEPF